MKKCFILFLSLLLSVSLFACGQKSMRVAPTVLPDAVAEVTLYAFNGDSERVPGLMNLGHAFVTVKNVSDSALKVGAYTLPVNEEVSIGTWGQNAHWGIWYNIESVYMMECDRYDGRISLTQGISDAALIRLNEYLKTSDTWTPFKNCSYFAVDVWNAASTAASALDLGGLITPARVQKQLQNTISHQTNRTVETYGAVGHADKDGRLVEFALKVS